MSFVALKTSAIEEPNKLADIESKEVVDMGSSNGMDIAQGTLLLHGKSHCNINKELVDAVGAELSQIFQEVSIERTNKAMVDIKLVDDCYEGCAIHTIDSLRIAGRKNDSSVKERGKESKSANKDLRSTNPSKFLTLQAQKGQTLAPPMKSPKYMAQAVTQTQKMHEETENCEPVTKVQLSKYNVDNNPASKCSNPTKSSSPKFTIARPFAFATDKRAEERPASGVPSCPLDLPQDVKNLCQRLFVAKSNHSNHIRSSFSQDLKVHTNSAGFKFRSDERAKKRKEFYCKLQEKSNAKLEQKAQMQAMTEKENEESLKVLRRSLTFKASPMPSFYQEGPPPKLELKKIPTTQAESPKFSMRGRRVSSESVSNAVLEVKPIQSNEHPEHLYGSIVDVLPKTKDGTTERLAKCSPDQQNTSLNASSSKRAYAAGKENKESPVEPCESELVENKQKSKEGTTEKHLVKGSITKAASSERHQSSKCSSNVLRNCANKGSPMSSSAKLNNNNMKPKVQPLPFDTKEDMSSPMTSKTTKKERLKALTPYFRTRDSIGNRRKSTTPPSVLAEEVATSALDKVGT